MTDEQKSELLANKKIGLTINSKTGEEQVLLTEEYYVLEYKLVKTTDDPGVVIKGSNSYAFELDIKLDDRLKSLGLKNEIVNRIQKTRKLAGVQFSDDILVSLKFSEKELSSVYQQHQSEIQRHIKKPVKSAEDVPYLPVYYQSSF